MTLTELFTMFILSLNGVCSPATIATYKFKLAIVAKVFGNMLVEHITVSVAQEHFNKLSESYAKKSVIDFLDITKAAFRYGVNAGKLETNPFTEVWVDKDISYAPLILGKKETEEILDTFSHDNVLFLPVLIAMETGLKRSEVLTLTWGNVDFASGEIIIIKNVISSKNHRYSEDRKGITIRITMSSKLSSILMAVRNYRRDNNIPVTASAYVCLTKNLKVMAPAYFDKLFRTFVKGHSEIPQNLRFHDIRWSCVHNKKYDEMISKGTDTIVNEYCYYKQAS